MGDVLIHYYNSFRILATVILVYVDNSRGGSSEIRMNFDYHSQIGTVIGTVIGVDNSFPLIENYPIYC